MNAQTDILIAPGQSRHYLWRELWQYRELLRALTVRNIAVHYKQAAIGVLWAVLRPALMLGVYTLIFGVVAQLPTVHDIPYALVVLTGLLCWFFILNGVTGAALSFLSDAPLVSKVYLPRMLLPLSHVLAAGVDFMITLLLLGVVMLCYGFMPPLSLLALPLLLLHLVLLVTAAGVLLASLTVRYRDFQHITPFLMQVGLYASPVVYTSQIVPEAWRWVYFLNPAAGVIEAFRWSLLGQPLDLAAWGSSLAVTLLLLLLAIRYFFSVERSLADQL